MKFIIVFIVSLTVAVKAALVSNLFMEEWGMFKMQHGKTYENKTEEEHRLRVYLNNSRMINEHNKRYAEGKVSFELGMNKFGDLHLHEFKRTMLMNNIEMNKHHKSTSGSCKPQSPYKSSITNPDSWSWLEQGAVTPVRNQLKCGSCWAFSAVGALESHHYIMGKRLVNLSEQNLIDCSKGYGNDGCHGGLPSSALLYVIDNGGIDTRESYSYIGLDTQKCHYDPRNSAETITDCRILPPNDEEQLKIAVRKEGPIAAAMVAGTSSFQFYKSGILYTSQCDNKHLDHAVLIVGYGSENGQDYWLVKNSWDTTWGEEGYFRIARNAGSHCGIASISVFPVSLDD